MELNVRPVPVPDPVSQFYWDAAKSGKLAIQGFPEIGLLQHPPSPVPEVAGGAEAGLTPSAVEVSGRGTLFAYTILHQPFHPGFVDAVPLIIGLTELDDAPGVRILTNIVEADPQELRCGLAMEVVFESCGDFALPQFRPVRDD
jgi:uncharacterized protein